MPAGWAEGQGRSAPSLPLCDWNHGEEQEYPGTSHVHALPEGPWRIRPLPAVQPAAMAAANAAKRLMKE